MKPFVVVLLSAVFGVLIGVSPAFAQPRATSNQAQKAPLARGAGVVEVVFALDTTGSMSDLITAAKQKIWSIANEIVTAKPTPLVKIGFVAYRDKGDAYVTQVHDLTDNLDAAFATLSKFKAAGGGDTPEHVNKALHDAVHSIHWSDARQTSNSLYQVIFLVGDCPPHTDYKDGYDYHKHAKEAIKRGIIVNTIRCGNDAQTQPIWQTIARLGEGEYFSIAQSGGVIDVPTPYDAEISKLSDKIEATTVAAGSAKARTAQKSSYAANAGAAPATKGDRQVFNIYSSQVYGEWDLVTGQMNKSVDVAKMKDAELPPVMQKMTPSARVTYINGKITERKQAQSKLVHLQKQRQAYVQNYMAKNRLNNKNAFDTLVKKAIRTQAARRHIRFQN